MKKKLAKEFLWFVFILVLALPLAFIFLWLLGFTNYVIDLQTDSVELILAVYLIGYILSVIGVYITRILIGTVKIAGAP